MKRRFATAVFLGFTLCHSTSSDVTDTNPATGVVTYINGVTVFDGINTRRETSHNGEVEMVAVTGESWWLAFPASGRIILEPYTPQTPRSYPEAVRNQFQSRVATNAVKLGEERVRGFPCWKYQVSSQRNAKIGPTEVVMYFLANTNFPLMVDSELVDVKLNCPVPPGTFTAPSSLKPASYFSPKPPFVIEQVERRESAKYGWKSMATNTFFGSSNSVVRRLTLLSISPHGTNYIGPRYETNAMHVGLSFLNAPAGAPYWGAARPEGRDTLLNLPAWIYTNARIPGDIYWVVDHPRAGTFSARHVQNSEDQTNTNEITRLEIGK